jgi:hypothetical protein
MDRKATSGGLYDPDELADRYVALWNEPDADIRSRALRELWAEDAVHILQPPQEVRKIAEDLGMDASLMARGRPALEVRVIRAYEHFVAPGEFRFRRRPNAGRLQDVVKFGWEMVRRADEGVAAAGLEFLVLGDDGRIRIDYQFIEP